MSCCFPTENRGTNFNVGRFHARLRERCWKRALKETLSYLERNQYRIQKGGSRTYFATDNTRMIRLRFDRKNRRIYLWDQNLRVNLRAMSPAEFLTLVNLQSPAGRGLPPLSRVIATQTTPARR